MIRQTNIKNLSSLKEEQFFDFQKIIKNKKIDIKNIIIK